MDVLGIALTVLRRAFIRAGRQLSFSGALGGLRNIARTNLFRTPAVGRSLTDVLDKLDIQHTSASLS